MSLHLEKLRQTLKNPLVRLSLILGILGAPPLWYSGVFVGQGRELLGGLLFITYVIIYTVDALITLTLLLSRD